MYRVMAPRYTTSRTWPDAEQWSGPTGAPGSSITIFSGRIVKAWSIPVTACAARPSRTFDTPTKPATNPVAGRS